MYPWQVGTENVLFEESPQGVHIRIEFPWKIPHKVCTTAQTVVESINISRKPPSFQSRTTQQSRYIEFIRFGSTTWRLKNKSPQGHRFGRLLSNFSRLLGRLPAQLIVGDVGSLIPWPRILRSDGYRVRSFNISYSNYFNLHGYNSSWCLSGVFPCVSNPFSEW